MQAGLCGYVWLCGHVSRMCLQGLHGRAWHRRRRHRGRHRGRSQEEEHQHHGFFLRPGGELLLALCALKWLVFCSAFWVVVFCSPALRKKQNSIARIVLGDLRPGAELWLEMLYTSGLWRRDGIPCFYAHHSAECQQASRCCLPPVDLPAALPPPPTCDAAQVPQPLPDNQLGGAARAHPDILRLLRQLLQQRPVWPAAALHEAVAAAGGTARSGTGGRYPADDLLPKLCYKFRNGGWGRSVRARA